MEDCAYFCKLNPDCNLFQYGATINKCVLYRTCDQTTSTNYKVYTRNTFAGRTHDVYVERYQSPTLTAIQEYNNTKKSSSDGKRAMGRFVNYNKLPDIVWESILHPKILELIWILNNATSHII